MTTTTQILRHVSTLTLPGSAQTAREIAAALNISETLATGTLSNLSRRSMVSRTGRPARFAAVGVFATTQPTRRSPRSTRSANGARQFGIEIEFSGLSAEGAAVALRSAGLNAVAEGYNHETRRHWKIVTDSTCGFEAVSPVLSGEDGYRQVGVAMKALREAGARVDTRCGMHVHHDMDGLSGAAIARFVEIYAARQSTIDNFVAPSRRRGNRWCEPLRSTEVDAIVSTFTARRSAPYVDRYRTVNVQSFPRYGTVEVRQHQGSLNGSKAVAWIKFGQALIAAAAADVAVADVPATPAGLVEFLNTSHSLDDAAAAYLAARSVVLATPEGDDVA